MNSYDELLSLSPTESIQSAFVKAYSKIHGYDTTFTKYNNIMVSISGGSDSDILLDFVERIGYPKSQVIYVFFDTGLEFKATKEHLNFLEKKYDIRILREKAVVPVAKGCKKYGVPFLSKQTSEWINRLQKHSFTWTDESFEVLYEKYPKCKSALRWWCNEWGETSRLNINRQKYLKEFIIKNPPDFMISSKCCTGAKKRTAKNIFNKFSPDLDIQGIRKAEGGSRAFVYKSCFDKVFGGCDRLRPLFWFKKEDKMAYEKTFGIIHSRCYTQYGLKRTGCACCPFGSNYEYELKIAQKYEPNLYKAAMYIFGKSYEYTQKYKEFCRMKKENLCD